MTQCSVGFSVSKNALNPYEPHREKTGFLHMRKKDADQLISAFVFATNG